MDRKLVREYQDRWRAVADVESAERHATTMAQRLREADKLILFVREANVDLSRREQEAEHVRRRWAKLYRALGGS